jgi:hypothetical protein
VASGDCSASGTDWLAAAAGFSDDEPEFNGVVSDRGTPVDEDVADPAVRGAGVSVAGAGVAGADASAGANGLETSLGTFMTMSLRAALPAATVTEGNDTSG